MTAAFPARVSYRVPLAGGSYLDLGPRTFVMGILNVTPDSFGDRERLDAAAAVDRAIEMEAQGADIIDIGGESTRPGAEAVDARTERDRILPVIERLRGRLRIPISVDTYKADVADPAVQAGAHMINDVSGLRYDPSLAEVAGRHGAALVLMHARGRSKDMYREAEYEDVVREVIHELAAAVEVATRAGVPRTAIVADPGIGFAKRAVHSYGVLARLPEIAAALDRPLLVGVSRKSFLRGAAGGAEAPDRDWPTAAAVTAAVLGGAHIVRVHAVGPMVQVVRAADEIRQAR